MTEAYLLTREQWVPSSLETVFAFFSDATKLELLTPSWVKFKVVTPAPIKMAVGTTIQYRLVWHGVPLRWTSEITRWEPPHAFEDIQLSGPCKLWHHTHRFEEVAGGTRMTDIVRYALPFGLLGRAAHALSVRRNFATIFEYRRARIQEMFGSPLE